MVDQEVVAKWVVDLAVPNKTEVQSDRFVKAAQKAWPRVRACAKRSISNRQISADEVVSLTLEIWEVTLRSVWKTVQQTPRVEATIENLPNYLIGAFHHRLNQHLKRDRRRDAVLEFVAPEELTGFEQPGTGEEDSTVRIHQQIQLMEVYQAMDERVRRAVVARTHGFSWREIASEMGIEEQNLIMRVQYAIRKMRARFARLPNGSKPIIKCM